jgi:hypothetical protein
MNLALDPLKVLRSFTRRFPPDNPLGFLTPK